MTPFDKCMSYTAVNSCEQNTSVPQFGWESLWGSSWSAPSHLFHAAGPMQILRQILTYLVCKMAVHFSLPLTHVGKPALRLSCSVHATALCQTLWADLSGDYWSICNANLAQEGKAGTVHLGLRTISSSCTSALHTTREVSPDPAR